MMYGTLAQQVELTEKCMAEEPQSGYCLAHTSFSHGQNTLVVQQQQQCTDFSKRDTENPRSQNLNHVQ